MDSAQALKTFRINRAKAFLYLYLLAIDDQYYVLPMKIDD